MQVVQGGSMVVLLLLLLLPLTSPHLAPYPSLGHPQPIDYSYSPRQGYGEGGQEYSSMMVGMVGGMVRAAASTAMDMVVDSEAMQVATSFHAIPHCKRDSGSLVSPWPPHRWR